MPKFKFLLFVFTLGTIPKLYSQEHKASWIKRYVNSIINDTSSIEKSTFTVYPTFGSSPETGVEIGASIMKLYFAKNDTLNRLSELNAFAFVTIKGQYGLRLENAIYGDKDKWFFLGESKIQQFPMSYYGIGPTTSGKNPALVDAFQITMKQRVLRKIVNNIFAGPGVDYQLLSGVDFIQPKQGNEFPLPLGSDGMQSLGVGAQLVFDNRHNVMNVRNGFFGEIGYYRYYPQAFGSLLTEIRSFHPIGKSNVLAWQVKGQFMNGDVPFHQLALLGGDKIMRGYYQGRYRDKNLLATQVEYRMLPFSFSKRIGAVAFAGAGVVSPTAREFQIRNTQATAGVGLRYLLFPKKDIFIRFDVGFTREGFNLYIYNGEAF